MQADIVTQPSMRVAAVRHLGPYTEISEAFERLGEIAGAAELFVPGAIMLGLYHDDPQAVSPGDLRSDAALTLADGVKAPTGTSEITVPAGRYAKLVYKGPYSGLPNAWGQLMDWMNQGGHAIGGPTSYELYRNDPTDTQPEDLITEICVPVS